MQGNLSWRLSRYTRQDLCERERHCLETCFASCACFCLISGSMRGPQKPRTHCENKLLRSYLLPSVFTIRSGASNYEGNKVLIDICAFHVVFGRRLTRMLVSPPLWRPSGALEPRPPLTGSSVCHTLAAGSNPGATRNFQGVPGRRHCDMESINKGQKGTPKPKIARTAAKTF